MGKLILIIPPSPWLISDRDIPMMGVLYLSSYLKENSDWEIIVCDLSSLEKDEWFIPVGDIYGITGTSPQFIYIKEIITLLKTREPPKPVIVGGVHATVYPDHLLNNTLADACIVGEGELALLSIMKHEEWKNITGVKTKHFDNGFANVIEDLDFIPFPDRKAIDYYSYLVPRTFNYMADVKKEASIITGRGCPFDCAFCASKKIHNGKVRLQSAASVLLELADLKTQFDVEMVNFLDDTFILDRKRVHDICHGLIALDLGIKWFCLTRVDCMDLETLQLMKKAGCLSVAIGFETGSNRLLKLMNKKATVSQAYRSIEMTNEADLLINGQLIVGLPTETDEDIELTARFIKESPGVDTFGLHVFQPYPGCAVWNDPERFGIFINKDTNFSNYHTIGKHNGKYHDDPIIDERYRYLKGVLGGRSREQRKLECR